MKHTIMEILSSSQGMPVSGVALSDQLGISRVAVWKHIQSLISEGYDIQSSSRGYCLVRDDDLLLPHAFPDRRERIHYFPSLSSTMDKARELARQGAPHLSVVVAGEQTKGRGRLNRHWFSKEGGLWFTVIVRPDLPPPLAFKVNFAASFCLTETLEAVCGIDARVKWPNDTLYQGKKLSGFLSEMETQGDMLSFVTVGIGINVNNRPEIDEPRAVSIKGITGRSTPRRVILSDFLERFEALLKTIHTTDIIALWKQRTATIGQEVSIVTPAGETRGLAVDVDESGALIIKDSSGLEKKVIYGDCFHRDPGEPQTLPPDPTLS